MRNNFEYSKVLLHYCLEVRAPFLYASSAAVYGAGNIFKEDAQFERPLNVYGYSKVLFDNYVRRNLPRAKSQVCGFRYFNVYGPRESHKGAMSSVAFHFYNQIATDGRVRLFEGSGGYEDGQQRRDFVYVSDVVDVNLWFLDHPKRSGIYNVGTGRSQPFNDVAKAVIAYHGHGEIEFIALPDHLAGCYQNFTQADTSALRSAGYSREFKTIEEGVTEYCQWLGNADEQ